MKERPILFSAPMVRALLAGTKTQTRRVVKPQPSSVIHDLFIWKDNAAPREELLALCPYGQSGDRLWVREAWQYADWTDDGYPWIGYRADDTRKLCDRISSEEWSERLMDTWAALSAPENYAIDNRAADRRWRPGIHMPRWASRILLEITGVRVERLQDISEADARAEGAPPSHPSIDRISREFGYADFPRSWYAQLWEQINGAGNWAANSWVWVVEFRRIHP